MTTPRTYRFAVTGYITVDDEALRRAFIGMDLERFLEESPAPDDLIAVERHRMDTIASNPLRVIMNSFLGQKYVERYKQVLINWIQADMPGANVVIEPVDVVDIAPGDD